MTKFIIFTTQRSGSTVLTKTLDEHPQVFAAGEIFHTNSQIHHPEWHFPFINYLGNKGGIIRKINKVFNRFNMKGRSVKHIDKFYTAKDGAEKARGFKLMLSQIKNAPYIWQQLKKQDVKIIVLIRKNIFQTALSKYRGQTTGVYHSDGSAAKKKMHIPAEEFAASLQVLEDYNKKLLQLTEGLNRIVIYYEDFGNWQNLVSSVFTFLGAEDLPLGPVLNKVGAKNWREDVENYQEVEQAMERYNYSAWLN